MFQRIKKYFQFVGKKTTCYFLFTTIGELISANLEIAFIGVLSLCFIKLGMLNPGTTLEKLNFLLQWPLLHLLILLPLVGLLRGIITYGISQTKNLAIIYFEFRLRLYLLQDILKKEGRSFRSAAEILNLSDNLFTRTNKFLVAIGNAVPHGFNCLYLACVMFYLAPSETGIALGGLVITALFVGKINHRLRYLSYFLPKNFKFFKKGIQRIVRNDLLIKSYQTEEQEYQELLKLSRKIIFNNRKTFHLISLSSVFVPILGTFTLTFILYQFSVSKEILSLTVTSFFYIFIRFLQGVGSIANSFSAMNSNYASVLLTYNFYSQLSPHEVQQALSVDLIPPPPSVFHEEKIKNPPAPCLELHNIEFSYNAPPSPFVIQNLNLHIKRGQQVGILGRSGSGKSTLVALLLGILKPTKGIISIDGEQPQIYFKKFPLVVGYVGSDPHLFEGSLTANLNYGLRRKATEEEYQAALFQAGLWDAIGNLKEGLNYKLNENGDGLSAGQKQRLALARALLRKPSLLILDEPSANLDVTTESYIAETLKELKNTCTMIIVSHRPGILKYADEVIHL